MLLTFHIFVHYEWNHFISFNQTWYKTPLDEGLMMGHFLLRGEVVLNKLKKFV